MDELKKEPSPGEENIAAGGGETGQTPSTAPPEQTGEWEGLLWGRERLREAVAEGSISGGLHQLNLWIGYLQDTLLAMEAVAERARGNVQSEGVDSRGRPGGAEMLVGLLKTNEFQQILAAIFSGILNSNQDIGR